MHLLRRLRAQQVTESVILLLEDMALDTRFQRILPMSNASAPSLRALEPVLMSPQPAMEDSGNIKVVVRVRKFVKRGK